MTDAYSRCAMSAAHDFDASLRVGVAHESELDAAFRARGWAIRPATREEQSSGIDRWLSRQGHTRSVEYKADVRSGETGRYALELVSVIPDDGGALKVGWALRCAAEWVVLYRPTLGRASILSAASLHAHVRTWLAARQPKLAAVRNTSWSSLVLLVDCGPVDAVASQTIEVSS